MLASVVLQDILNSPDKLGAASPKSMTKDCEAEGNAHRRVRRSLYSEHKQADSADSYSVLGSSRKRPNSPGSVEEGQIVKRRRIDCDSPCLQKSDDGSCNSVVERDEMSCRSSPRKVRSLVLEKQKGDWKVSTPGGSKTRQFDSPAKAASVHKQIMNIVDSEVGAVTSPRNGRIVEGGLTPILREPKSDRKDTPSKSVTFHESVSNSAKGTPKSCYSKSRSVNSENENEVSETRSTRRRSVVMEKLEELDENENDVSNDNGKKNTVIKAGGVSKAVEHKTPEKAAKTEKKNITPKSSSQRTPLQSKSPREGSSSDQRGRKSVQREEKCTPSGKSSKRKPVDSENEEIIADESVKRTPVSALRNSQRRQAEIFREVMKSVPGTGRILRPRTPKCYKMKLSLVSDDEDSDNSFKTSDESVSEASDEEETVARRTPRSAKRTCKVRE
jgi:hypothetical protein